MAILRDNMIMKGLSGRFGDAVYKVLRGKTIVTKIAKKSNSYSELQQGTRTKFKEASAYAKAAMLNAERKAYYQKKAIKLKVPNAYTAALTDYMRKPKVKELTLMGKPPMLEVAKKDFEIKKVMMRLRDGTLREISSTCKSGNVWDITFTKEQIGLTVTVIIEDETGQLHTIITTLSTHLHRSE